MESLWAYRRKIEIFSHGKGFYFNKSFAETAEFIKHFSNGCLSHARGPVLLYIFSGDRLREVQLSNNKIKWATVLRYYRSGARDNIYVNFETVLNRADYIITEISKGNETFRQTDRVRIMGCSCP